MTPIIIETITGNKPQEQIDILLAISGEISIHIIAYNKGNGYVKLFTSFQDFFDWYVYGKNAISTDISLDLYNNDRDFKRFLEATIFPTSGKR